MAAHRYWRATAFEAYGTGDLELSEFHLLAGGVRADAPATLTASVAPDVSGVLADLQDDVLTTSARWSAQGVKGLALTWDFGGSTADVDDIRLAGDSEVRFPLIFKIQSSDDAITWVELRTIRGIAWPGLLLKTQSSGSGGSGVGLLNLAMNGVNGGTSFPANTGADWTPAGGVVTSTAQSKFRGSSALFNGSGARIVSPATLNFAGDYTIKGWLLQSTRTASYHCLFDNRDGGSVGNALYLADGDLALASHSAVLSPTLVPKLEAGVWTFWSLSFVSGVFYGHLGGQLIWSVADARAVAGLKTLFIGASNTGGQAFAGYLSDVTINLGVGEYVDNYAPPLVPTIGEASSIIRNKILGRVTDTGTVAVGGGPIMAYGTPQIALPDYLSIESGSIKDQITGVLGEGIGRVKGTVATKGSPNQPVHRKVRLIRERDGVVIREAWSDATTGEYDFQWVDEAQTYTVVSYDHLHNYRAVIADNLVPELMP